MKTSRVLLIATVVLFAMTFVTWAQPHSSGFDDCCFLADNSPGCYDEYAYQCAAEAACYTSPPGEAECYLYPGVGCFWIYSGNCP
jgi:hypothetical protein